MISDVVIKPKHRWFAVAWELFITCLLIWTSITLIGASHARDEWKRIALNAQRQLRAEGEACPAPKLADVCPAWWFGSKDLAAARSRLCK